MTWYAGGVRALIWRTVDKHGSLPAHVRVSVVDFTVERSQAGLRLTVGRKVMKRAALGPQVSIFVLILLIYLLNLIDPSLFKFNFHERIHTHKQASQE